MVELITQVVAAILSALLVGAIVVPLANLYLTTAIPLTIANIGLHGFGFLLVRNLLVNFGKGE